MGDFEQDAILYFMLSKGGRVRNHELVTHFRNFLNHPVNKAANREKFKDFVNELATIKLDGGDKVLVLKKKYRPDNFGSSSTTSSASGSSSSLSLSGLSVKPGFNSSRESIQTTPPRKESGPPTQHESPRAQSEPPSGPSPSKAKESDSVDGAMSSKVRSDENMEVVMRSSNRVPPPTFKVEDTSSMAGSTTSITSSESQRSIGSSTSGVASMEEDANASVISVKDKIRNLNKIHSETDLNHARHHPGGGGNKKSYKNNAGDDDSSYSSGSSYVTLDAEQKDWMVVCSTSEYHDMNRLLSKNPALAKLKDFTNGYTALHWAAKTGKSEVIKLVANKPGVNVDQRSHGGYTALHLAAIHGHEHIIELLVQVFKADPNLRDYSGKKAKQYLKNSASSKAQQLLVSRRLGSDLHPNKSLDDSFIRSASMRMSNRARAMSSLLQVKSSVARSSWGGSTEDLHDNFQPASTGSSPRLMRRKHSSRDGDLMPPPSNTMLARRLRHSDRSLSSSRESSSSPKQSRRGDENQNMLRAESDPVLLERDESKHTIV